MSHPTKLELIAGLQVLRNNVCAYSGSKHCDCKFGTKPMDVTTEHTGCPEVVSACALLAAMTTEEYEALVLRVYPSDRAKEESLPPRTWLPLSAMRIGEEFVTKSGAVGKRAHPELGTAPDQGVLRVRWSETGKVTNMGDDTLVARLPYQTVTTKPEPEGAALLLSDLTIGESFKTRTGRAGVRVENTNHQSIYLGVQWEDGGVSHENPSMAVWPIKTMRVATMPTPGLFAKLREMGARVKRESFRGDLLMSITIGDDPKKQWSSYRRDLATLVNLIAFAKANVPGPWFVDLEPEDAKPLWVALGVVEQTQLRALRPNDAPPGFMFSFCGVDVCEAQP